MAAPIPSDVPIEEYVAFEDDNNPPYPILDDDANALPMQARNTRTRSAAICSAIAQSNTQYYLKKLTEDIAKNPALTQKVHSLNIYLRVTLQTNRYYLRSASSTTDVKLCSFRDSHCLA